MGEFRFTDIDDRTFTSFLDAYGVTKSVIRFTGINFYNLDRTTERRNHHNITYTRTVVRDLDGTLGQLLKTINGNLNAFSKTSRL